MLMKETLGEQQGHYTVSVCVCVNVCVYVRRLGGDDGDGHDGVWMLP